MSDPLLEALRILPRLFALTAKGLSPISIRDQMVRAQMLVIRALEQGEITRGDKILVVGAGAAGAVAAMTCARCGICGCSAGLYREALHEIYIPRIQRGNASFAAKVLGVRGALLSVLVHFFENGR
jgi:hypothetical protein